MERKLYNPPGSPPTYYSQAAIAGNIAFLSGQMSLDPVTGAPIHGTMAQQTRRALTNLQDVLTGMGAGLKDVLMMNLYITSMDLFDEMNEVYMEFFPSQAPARCCVAIKELYDNLDLELTCVAMVPEQK